jgi:two-component system sensor histidine kinase MprB
MDPIEQERAFERFYQGSDPRTDGFGLGLAIVRQAVRALGGTVELESAPGQGTTARIVLTSARREAA